MDTRLVANVTSVDNYSLLTNTSSENRTSYLPKQNNNVYYIVALVLSWTNAVLIISLNTAVIVTILRYKKRSRLYFLLLNLAIADLLTGLADAFPHSIERSVGVPYFQMLWVFGEATCKIQRTLANMSMTASNYILAATSFDRAMVIFRPMTSFKRGHVLQKCMIISCWVFSFLVSSPYLDLIVVKPAYNAEGWYSCSIDWGDKNPVYMWKILLTAMFVYVFAIPFIVIVVSYTILLVSIYQRTMTSKSIFKSKTPVAGTHVFNRGLPKSKIKSIKLTCGIIFGFLISWLVFFVFMFMNVFRGFRHQFLILVVTFYYWSSVANPIMFFIYHQRRPRTPSTTTTSMFSSDTARSRCSSEFRLSTNLRENGSITSSLSTRAISAGTELKP